MTPPTLTPDLDAIDDAVLALLFLTLHARNRASKNFAWSALNRLHARRLISKPVDGAKSVVLTEEGLRESARLFRQLFERPLDADDDADPSRELAR